MFGKVSLKSFAVAASLATGLTACAPSSKDPEISASIERALHAAEPVKVGSTIPWDYVEGRSYGFATLRVAPQNGECPEFDIKVVRPGSAWLKVLRSDISQDKIKVCGIKTVQPGG